MGGIFGGLPREAEKSTLCDVFHTFWSLYVMLFWAVCCRPWGCGGAGAHLEKQVFAWRVCRISVFGVFRAGPEKTENETKNSSEINTKKQVKAKAKVTAESNRNDHFPGKVRGHRVLL